MQHQATAAIRPGDARLTPGPGGLPDLPAQPSTRPRAAAVAAHLLAPARKAGAAGLIYLAVTERRAEEIGRAARSLAPDIEVLVLPPWDCLPYDRASPSREAMGRRMTVLAALAAKARGPRLLVLSPDALLQRIPPRAAFTEAFEVVVGEALDRERLRAFALRAGYVEDDRIDEPGEIGFLGEVIDVFPADAAAPARIQLGEGDRIEQVRVYDPVSQRSEAEVAELRLPPASELLLEDGAERTAGLEHRLPEHASLQTVFDLAPKARLVRDADADAACARFHEQVQEAFETRRSFGDLDGSAPLPPERLYLTDPEADERMAGLRGLELDLDAIAAAPSFATARNPGRAFCSFVQAQADAGLRVVITGLRQEQRALARALRRGLDLAPQPAEGWAEALEAAPGSILALEADLDLGFVDPSLGVAAITATDVLGGRIAGRRTPAMELLGEPDLRIGDVVIHEDHGLGVLQALERTEVDGEARDLLRLEYHGGATLLAPVEEFDRIWRYGSEAAAVTLDRLKGDGWARRRAEVSRHINETAAQLVELARARTEAKTEPLAPPRPDYLRFAAGFPFPETPDQAAAIEAVLADLASGQPMNRLVCGDVGFGKTEVALRAAAAAVLAGKQAIVVAPTTVLARQHLETFRRRFAAAGVEVAQLSRLVATAEAREVKAGLASGELRLVVGTHALAAEDIAFADLGLVIVDEEQRFGAKVKDRLHQLAPHLLTLTATPIPRTLQGALVGVQEVSVIASPPARRRPIRTFLTPFDPAAVRTALLREQRRGGQSFFVVPRIEDIAPMQAKLAELIPELGVQIAHGEVPAEQVDEVMVSFADGRGDVLLATNIIESGLDVPRANTMLIWRADRFGLAQLHQLRGRVGRGRAQGVAYLLTDPAEEIAEDTRARLSTLEAFDRLGSGFAISARDLDLRGGGDLVGDEQAGHMKLIGAGLYQRLLERAVRAAKGEALGDDRPPSFQTGAEGFIPEDYVPDEALRINLYARLARIGSADEVDAFQEELEDRFGPLPDPAAALLALGRLKALARAAGVTQVVSGPKAVALTLKPAEAERAQHSIEDGADGIRWSENRLICEAGGEDRLSALERLLTRLAA